MMSSLAWPGYLVAFGNRLSATRLARRILRTVLVAVLALSVLRVLGLG